VSTTANFRNITIGVPLGQCATPSRTLISNLSALFGFPVSPHAVSSLVKGNDELSSWLLDKCIAYAKAHAHPERPDHTVWEVFEEERPKLVPIVVASMASITRNARRMQRLWMSMSHAVAICPSVGRAAHADPYRDGATPQKRTSRRLLPSMQPTAMTAQICRITNSSARSVSRRLSS
jgi:hypothetical protein